MPRICSPNRLVGLLALGVASCDRQPTISLPHPAGLAECRREQRQSRRPRIPEDQILDLLPAFRPRCNLHDRTLLPDVVPIGQEIVEIDDDYLAGLHTAFPRAHSYEPMGCIPPEQSHARVRFCPDYRVAKAAWLARRHGW